MDRGRKERGCELWMEELQPRAPGPRLGFFILRGEIVNFSQMVWVISSDSALLYRVLL